VKQVSSANPFNREYPSILKTCDPDRGCATTVDAVCPGGAPSPAEDMAASLTNSSNNG
jgi:hypothetical protein